MTINQLIQQLQEAEQKFGNLEVRVFNVYDGNYYPPADIEALKLDENDDRPVNVIGISEA